MGDDGAHVDASVGDGVDGGGIEVAIAEDGLDGQLLGGHGGGVEAVHAVLAQADDDDGAGGLGGGEAVVHGGGEAGAIDADIRAAAGGQLHDLGDDVLILGVDGGSAQLGGLFEALVDDIAHDDLSRAVGPGGQQGDQADAARAHDDHGLAQLHAALIAGVEADGQGLHQRALGEGHVVRNLEGEGGGMGDILAEHAVIGRGGPEAHVLAEVVVAAQALLALHAGHAGLHADAVAGLEVLDVRAHLADHARGLMAEDEGELHLEIADGAGAIVVQVRAANAHGLNLDQHIIRANRGHRSLANLNFFQVGHVEGFIGHVDASCSDNGKLEMGNGK